MLAPERQTTKIGASKCRRHVFDELENLCRLAQRLICGQRVIIVTLSGLMDDVNSGRLALQHGQAANHGFIDGVRTLASAENENRRRATAFRRNFEKCLAHWNAGDFAVAKILSGLLEVNGCP